MKAIIPATLSLAVAIFCVANSPKKEAPPAGAEEKIAKAIPEKPFAEPKKDRKLLVFSRTVAFRHASIPTGKLAFSKMGEKTGAFTAVVSDDLSNFEPENISQFDAICFLSTTRNVFAPSPEERKALSKEEKKAADEYEKLLKDSLMNYVKSGGGFVGIHAATDTFHEWPEYLEMINGVFDGHPWMAKHEVTINVEPGKENHPLVAMFEGGPIVFKEEIYQHKDPYDSSKVEMLLRLDPEKSKQRNEKLMKRTDGDFGVSWVRTWGEGRVFYCSLGHNHDMFWRPKVMQHYLAGIQWALGDFEVEIEEGK